MSSRGSSHHAHVKVIVAATSPWESLPETARSFTVRKAGVGVGAAHKFNVDSIEVLARRCPSCDFTCADRAVMLTAKKVKACRLIAGNIRAARRAGCRDLPAGRSAASARRRSVSWR